MSKEAFKRIGEQALASAENVPCDVDEYHVGLAILWHEINERCESEGVNPRDPDMLAQMDD